MKIAMGADHGGYSLKEILKKHLVEAGHEVLDLGTHDTSSCNYPVYAEKVAYAVADKDADLGVLICGTGIGMSIAANKVKGIRAAAVSDCGGGVPDPAGRQRGVLADHRTESAAHRRRCCRGDPAGRAGFCACDGAVVESDGSGL